MGRPQLTWQRPSCTRWSIDSINRRAESGCMCSAITASPCARRQRGHWGSRVPDWDWLRANGVDVRSGQIRRGQSGDSDLRLGRACGGLGIRCRSRGRRTAPQIANHKVNALRSRALNRPLPVFNIVNPDPSSRPPSSPVGSTPDASVLEQLPPLQLSQVCEHAVGATLVVARVGSTNAAGTVGMGRHKGVPYGLWPRPTRSGGLVGLRRNLAGRPASLSPTSLPVCILPHRSRSPSRNSLLPCRLEPSSRPTGP